MTMRMTLTDCENLVMASGIGDRDWMHLDADAICECVAERMFRYGETTAGALWEVLDAEGLDPRDAGLVKSNNGIVRFK